MSTTETPEKQPAPAKPEAPPKQTVAVKNLQGEVIAQAEGETISTASYYKLQMPQANFKGEQLNSVTFYCSNLEGASFEGANLHRANLQVCNLQNANLKGADLRLANLINANLCGADLTDSSFEHARAWGAKYNKQTKFPKGFKTENRRLISQD